MAGCGADEKDARMTERMKGSKRSVTSMKRGEGGGSGRGRGLRDVSRLKSTLIDRLRSEVFNLLAWGDVTAEATTKSCFNRGPHTLGDDRYTHSVRGP